MDLDGVPVWTQTHLMSDGGTANTRKEKTTMDSQVRDNPEKHRFERQIHDGMWAAAYCRLENGKFVFVDVEVPEFASQGVAPMHGEFKSLRIERDAEALLSDPVKG
jgi:uncharacterized protein